MIIKCRQGNKKILKTKMQIKTNYLRKRNNTTQNNFIP